MAAHYMHCSIETARKKPGTLIDNVGIFRGVVCCLDRVLCSTTITDHCRFLLFFPSFHFPTTCSLLSNLTLHVSSSASLCSRNTKNVCLDFTRPNCDISRN